MSFRSPTPDPALQDGLRPAEPASTGFGSTLFDQLEPAPPAASVFDVCHVGVVLRALLFVHGVLAVGVLFGVTSFWAWFAQFASASSMALPAVLLWLIGVCAGRRVLEALSPAWRWLLVLALGGACGAASALLSWVATGGLTGAVSLEAPALAGAGLAGVMLQWLLLRAQASLPAETAARLAELQSRIRPHFLFNTLNSALALVRHDPERAEGLLEDLAELFRVAISGNAESVTLGQEIELARRYLDIEAVRFGARLQLHWDLDPAAAPARVPPLMLQPLVENAVRHGVEPSDTGGTIRVRTRVKMGRALISIVNSVPQATSRPGHGMALRNVRERLRLMHDVAAQFDARRDGDSFRVQIVVPL